ncbi:ABUW_2363 family tetratricopeptide repeat lipoprotein [Acinetobacter johnsonii]|jgi:tetratricopeptide (TPR) repeat protein|uniref:ABUW_2363 family tetratricopeptide repeat lipoprotein n=1 Tax=Acinetobacter johnsonii TaxID=40214 RepID=UPI003016811E
MMLKPLAVAVLAVSFLTACSSNPTKNNSDTIIFTEPELTAPFYALNPFNYDAPPPFEINLKKAAAQPVTKMEVTRSDDPSKKLVLDTNKLIIPTVNSKDRQLKFAVLAGDNEVDITEIDDFLQLVEGKARHYPPRFTERQERKGFELKLKEVTQQLDTLASKDNASFDVLVRAFKASVMARNLDLGSVYTTKSLAYAQRILKINQEDPEANFWFGFALSEGGGQREAMPYLDKAMKAGVQEAYLATANNYIAMEQKKNAVQTLKNYKLKYPQEAEVADRLINEIEKQGRWNVWQVLNTAK